MDDVYGVYSWAVRTYECGPDGRATMASVCNWLQEAASLNAETLAFSKSDFEAAGENISWVLTRLKVRIARFPKWEEKVSILTFPRGGRRARAMRSTSCSSRRRWPARRCGSNPWRRSRASTSTACTPPTDAIT